MLFLMYQVFSSLQGHLHFFVHLSFTFMEHFFLTTPYLDICTDGRTDQQTSFHIENQMNGRTDMRTYGRMDMGTDIRTDAGTDTQTDGHKERCLDGQTVIQTDIQKCQDSSKNCFCNCFATVFKLTFYNLKRPDTVMFIRDPIHVLKRSYIILY